LPQIIPLFPDKINTFVDLFAGGCNVSMNVCADKIICNDAMKPLVAMYKCFQENSIEDIYKHIYGRIEQFNLSKTNQDGFLSLRKLYNENKNPLDLYVCICYSFNNQIRFNKSDEFNMPFGKNRSSFNSALESRLKYFIAKIKQMILESYDFRNFNYNNLTKKDLVYVDPPYLISIATYNENGGWNDKDENDLYNLLDNLHKQDIKFALSNVIEHKGAKNNILSEWANKYNSHYLKSNYSNCSYQIKDKKNKSIEVLITNY
jgi:DNA adenine methylase